MMMRVFALLVCAAVAVFASAAEGEYNGEWKGATLKIVVKGDLVDILATAPLVGTIIQGENLPYSHGEIEIPGPVPIDLDYLSMDAALKASTNSNMLLWTRYGTFKPEHVAVEYHPVGKDGLTDIPMIKVTVTPSGGVAILKIEAQLGDSV